MGFLDDFALVLLAFFVFFVCIILRLVFWVIVYCLSLWHCNDRQILGDSSWKVLFSGCFHVATCYIRSITTSHVVVSNICGFRLKPPTSFWPAYDRSLNFFFEF